jgi:hypothetical protein
MNKFVSVFLTVSLLSCVSNDAHTPKVAPDPAPQASSLPLEIQNILDKLFHSEESASQPTEEVTELHILRLPQPISAYVAKERIFKTTLKQQESIVIESDHKICSGVFIGHNLVLTASHCFRVSD